MYASDREILTLRPEGFPLDRKAIEAFVRRIPGTYRSSEQSMWVIVVPASDMPRMKKDPAPKSPRILGPQYVLVDVDDEKVEVHPGYSTMSWASAQRVIKWLLGLGPWRVRGLEDTREYDHGVIRTEQELFRTTYYDPDEPFQIPDDLTASPPVVGKLTSFSRKEGPEVHTLMRVHDSGAFSCEIEDELRWDGRLTDEFIDPWNSMVAALDFSEKSKTYDNDDSQCVSILVEDAENGTKYGAIDARYPQPSFAALVQLMNGWIELLLDERIPPELTDVRLTYPKEQG